MAAASESRALTALVTGGLVIATVPLLVRVSEAGPSATAFWRLALPLPLLAAWRLVERRREPVAVRRSDVGRLALAGVCFAGDLGVWHVAIQWTTIANASLLVNLAPVFVTLVAWAWLGERVTGRFAIALAVALGGATILVGPGFELGGPRMRGDALALLSAVFYAGYLLAVQRLRATRSTAVVMLGSGFTSAVLLLAAAVATGERLVPPTPRGWTVLLLLAFVSQLLGQTLIGWALAHLPVSLSSVGLLLQPVGATVLAAALFGEPLGPRQLGGGALVLAGVLLAQRARR